LHFEGEERSVEQVEHFMGNEPGALVCARRFLIEGGLILLASEFGHRACDRVIQTPVQHSEVVCGDVRVHLHGEFGNRLAHVAVVVHDL
jgi:hypothetical protein